MKFGYSQKTGEFYVAEFNRQKGRVEIVETSSDAEKLGLKYGFFVDDDDNDSEDDYDTSIAAKTRPNSDY